MYIKKIKTLIFFIFLIFGFIAEASSLKIVPPEAASYGELITVPIVGIDFSEGTGIVGLQFKLNYDASLIQFMGYESSISHGTFTVGQNINSINILWDSFPSVLKLNNENLILLKFNIISNSVANVNLSHSEAEFANSSAESVAVSIIDGTISIGPKNTSAPVSTPTPTTIQTTPTKKLSTKDIVHFSIPVGTTVINQSTRNITIKVPPNTDLKFLKPAISITGLYIQPLLDTIQDFTKPVRYTVTAEDMSTQVYTVTVSHSALTPTSTAGGNSNIVNIPITTRPTPVNPIVPPKPLTPTARPTTTPRTVPAMLRPNTSTSTINLNRPTINAVNNNAPLNKISSVFSKDLSLGSKDLDVERLQKLLATDKSIYPEGLVTGTFGPLTEKAVKAFQKKYNLPQVGRVGPMTRERMQEVFGQIVSNIAVQKPTAPMSSFVFSIKSDLSLGNSGDEVNNLQKLLSSDTSIYPEGLVTGTFGPLTEKAVKAFQKKYNLPQVGRVGPMTREKMQEVFRGAATTSKIPTGLSTQPKIISTSTTETNQIMEQIKKIQTKINELMKSQ